MSTDRTSSVAVPPEGGKKKGLWWLWPLLALLAVIAVIALIASCGDDDDEEESATSGTTATQTQPADNSTVPQESQTDEQAGTLAAGGQDLLPETAGALEGAIGEQASGKGLYVLRVVEDEGFFVGQQADSTEAVYVELGGDVGENEAENGLPAVGDRVDLTGEVRPAPEDPGRTLRLEADQAQVVEDQGAFVNAEQVTAAK